MIAAHLNTGDESTDSIMFILEPPNMEKLQLGQPIVKLLNDFLPNLPAKIEIILAYTPDIVWVGEQLAEGKGLAQTLSASITRPAIYNRHLDPEALVKGDIKTKD